MFRQFIFGILSLVILSSVFLYQSVNTPSVSAGGGLGIFKVTFDKSQAAPDGVDSINMTIFRHVYNCTGSPQQPYNRYNPEDCQQFDPPDYTIVPKTGVNSSHRIEVSGSGNTVSPETFKISHDEPSSSAYVNIKSTVAEVKTVKLFSVWSSSDVLITTETIEFKVPTVSQAPAPVATPTKTYSKPDAPIVSNINEKTLSEDKSILGAIRENQPITITGNTTKNSKLKLYIFSDPIEAEATSDKNGDWTYTIEEGLEVGDHRVEAEVTDSNGSTSDRAEILKFSVIETVQAIDTETDIDSAAYEITLFTYIAIGIAIVLILLLAFLIIRRKRALKISSQES